MSRNADPYESLGRYIARVVAQQPHPPRRVRWVDIVEFVIGLRGASALFTPALVLVFATLVATFWPGWSPIRVAVILLVIPAAATLLARPLLSATRLLAALRTGIFTSAVVSDIRDTDDGVRGRCDVRALEDAFEARFDLAAPWAADLRIGSMMVVLIHPRRRRVLWFVGHPMG